MAIRESLEADHDAIAAVHREAFGKEGEAIAQLVLALFADPTARPLLSLVAEDQCVLVGHILFSPVYVDGAADAGGYILSPLAVRPASQRSGVGSALIERGLAMLGERGARFVLVLGDPDYYSRRGFRSGHALQPPHEIPYPEAWMAQELEAGALVDIAGAVRCADALNAPEHW